MATYEVFRNNNRVSDELTAIQARKLVRKLRAEEGKKYSSVQPDGYAYRHASTITVRNAATREMVTRITN
jgi:hypothetical protein